MSISRRKFVTGVAAGTLVASTAKAGAVKHFEGYPNRMGLLHDTTLCVGCRSCEFACNKVNDLPPPEAPVNDRLVFNAQRRNDETLYTVVNRYVEARDKQPAIYRKHQCMHCNEPCCASVCFVSAFEKTPEGPVLYNPDVCVGCRYCVFACPYNALAYEYNDPLTPRVVRCTMCYPRIKQGLNPACADACPTGAIIYGRREDLIWVARERIRKNPQRYIDQIFGENEYGGTSWLCLAGVEFSRLGLPEGLPTEPLPNLTTGFLSLAPLAAAIFPALLGGFYAFTKRREALTEEEKRAVQSEAEEKAKQEMKEKIAALKQQAERTQEYAIKQAVKDALREAAKPEVPPRKDDAGGGS
ncbi:MAG: 4Fe-4S dicluster domain-containing protein [Deltaproteobacteria bacterium]|nr:4Fe-4S dicluster domain-containing protein [Deltaproteobacteria bacterium]